MFINRLTRIGCIDIDQYFAIIEQNGLSLMENFYEIITNDAIIVNLLSRYAIGHVAAESEMLHLLIMKTRVVLNDFGIATIKLNADIDRKMDRICRIKAKSMGNLTNRAQVYRQCQSRSDGNIMPSFIIEHRNDFRKFSASSWTCIKMKMGFSIILAILTIYLFALLLQTRKQLSMTSILFVYNIIQANILFLISFLILFYSLLVNDGDFGKMLKLVKFENRNDNRKSF
jgi:hypothetical protein